jgi:BlaR1 peptidase M56
MILYLLQSSVCLMAFYALYACLFSKETFFHLNRFFLMFSALASLCIPMLHIAISDAAPVLVHSKLDHLPQLSRQMQIGTHAVETQLNTPITAPLTMQLGELVFYLYLTGLFALVCLLAYRLFRLFQVIQKSKIIKKEGYSLALPEEDTFPAASFFQIIFLSNHHASKDQHFIFKHELAHVRGFHSIDVLLTEILVIVQWFNPVAWLFRKSIRATHEYIADDWVVRNTQSKLHYALFLAQTAGHTPHIGYESALPHHFHSQLKKRLAMLSKSPSFPYRRAKYLLALPLTLVLLVLFSFRFIDKIVASPQLQAAANKEISFPTETSTLSATDQQIVQKAGLDLMAEKTPFILYWGSIQIPILNLENTETYFGEVEIKGSEFFQSIDNEPRLWNGKDLEQLVRFTLSDGTLSPIKVIAMRAESQQYLSCRKVLNERYFSVQAGARFEISDLVLPNGKTANLRLRIFAPSPVPVVYPHFEWGQYSSLKPNEGRRLTVAQFWAMSAHIPKLLKNTKELIKPATITLLAKKEDPIILSFESCKAESYATVLERLKQKSAYVQPETMIFIDMDGEPSTVFGIYADQDPTLSEKSPEAQKFGFKIGAFEQTGQAFGKLARPMMHSGPLRKLDKPITFGVFDISANDFMQMLVQHPLLMLNGAEKLPEPKFTMQFGDLNAQYSPSNGLPADFVRDVKQRLQAKQIPKIIELSGVQNDEWDLSHITFQLRLADVITSKTDDKATIKVDKVWPNPVLKGMDLRIAFTIPAESEVQISVYDASLRLISETKKTYAAGQSEIFIKTSDLNELGVYQCKLSSKFGSTIQTFMLR